jgi:hypothetical protein
MHRRTAVKLLAAGLVVPATLAPAAQGPVPGTHLPPVGSATPLAADDFRRAAGLLDCEVAAIQAVSEVESSGGGFQRDGRPKILFEAHIFSRRTGRAFDATHPDISSPQWDRSLYQRGEKEYPRLLRAMALNRQAGLESASWGRFQIMGFNHKLAGYDGVEPFVAAMFGSEGKHLDAFVQFLKSTRLDAPLREHRWADFAKGYNGANFAVHRYDVKLRDAYERHRRP